MRGRLHTKVINDGKENTNKAEIKCNPAIIANHTCSTSVDWRDEEGDMNLLADEIKQTNSSSEVTKFVVKTYG